MKYYSTRKTDTTYTLTEAVLQGLSPDGGLFVPAKLPHFSVEEFANCQALDEFAFKLLEPFFIHDVLHSSLAKICKRSFSFPLPLVELSSDLSLLELYHGPTASFKDIGARFLANALSFVLQDHDKLTILVATSGDTGSAVASAFHQKDNIQVVVLFPLGKVSTRQEHLLSCYDGNVCTLAVEGTFDECQKMVKATFANEKIASNFNLSSANSINIGRLLPQSMYYARSSIDYFQRTGKEPGFIVPTGNLGNALAAMLAQKMGFPIREVVIANNKNAVLSDYFATKLYQPKKSIATLANAMDVGSPSNMERLLHYYPKIDDLEKSVSAYSVDDEEIKNTIIKVYSEFKLAICPHTATAFNVYQRLSSRDWILVSTAHPAKFFDIVEPLIEKPVQLPNDMRQLLAQPSCYKTISTDLRELQNFLGK